MYLATGSGIGVETGEGLRGAVEACVGDGRVRGEVDSGLACLQRRRLKWSLRIKSECRSYLESAAFLPRALQV